MKEGISICVTAYQTQDYIEECLDSIYKQTYFKTNKNYEVLLGIDGCEKVLEKIEKIAYKYPNFKVFLMNKNVGTYVTSNTIMCNADYKWLMRFDSDDIMPENFVEEVMNNNEKADIVRYYMKKFEDSCSFDIAWGSCLINKETFIKYGGYRNWRFNADFDFLYRLENEVNIKILKNVFYYRRYRKNSLSTNENTGINSQARSELYEFTINQSKNNKIINCITTDYTLIYNSFENITTSEIKNNIIKKFTDLQLINDVDNPQTIQEKIQWLKIYDSTPLKSLCADKIKVHEYCKEKLNKDICVPIYKIYDNADEINLDVLPSKFVLKCNCGYHQNIVVKDKQKFNLQDAKNKLNDWLKKDFGYISNQPHYSQIERKIFSEKYLNDGHDALVDYKISCFNGEPKIINICLDRDIEKNSVVYNYYDENLVPLYVSDMSCKANYNIKTKPKNVELMKEYAKKLSENFKFVRVDFYEIDNEIYLGELTFTPGNGILYYENDEDKRISLMFGDMLNLK